MKKIFITLVFAVIAMLAFNNAATASVTINFTLKVDDRCAPTPYTGTYTITVYIIVNGTPICQNSQNGIQGGMTPNTITFLCDGDLFQSSHYEVRVDICRDTNPPSCCTSDTKNDINMNQLTGITPWIDIVKIS
jgi:hypothetical protein